MSKEQVMDYVMNSPANTNPNVLTGMLDSIADAGGGSSRVLLYENDAVTFDQDGASPIKYKQFSTLETMLFGAWEDSTAFSVEIDGEIVLTGTASEDKLGLTSPGDTEGVADGKPVGVTFTSDKITPSGGSTINLAYAISMLIIDTSKHSGNTHSVKIYAEL